MHKITEYLEILLAGGDLSFAQAEQLLDIVFEGQVPEAQIAAFLTAMRAKGALPCELAGLAKSLREHAVQVKVDCDNLVDTCGTGGASIKTFNISTAAAFVAAGAGVNIAKHGNRGITSKCGSADVLAQLGVKIDCAPEVVAKCIEEAKIGFMFAPMFHPAMKYVQPVRKSLDFRTVFNILGPLANPARATAQVMGVASEDLMETIIETLKLLDTKQAMVVHSQGLDEISTFGQTKILRLAAGQVSTAQLEPAELGISASSVDELKGDDAAVNARIIMDILKGKETAARKDIVVLNAAAAIIVAGDAASPDLTEDFKLAIEKARVSIADGRALECLEKLIEVSNR